MKLKQHHPKAALRILAGLLLFFMAIAPLKTFGATGDNWKDYQATSLGRDGETGGANSPFTINTPGELAYLAALVNDGAEAFKLGSSETNITILEGFQGSCIKLAANIDLSAHNWTPIGKSGNLFRGYFDGDGNKVEGLKIDIDETGYEVYAGLFGYVEGGSIRNLGVGLATEGIVVSTNGNAFVGGIAGCAILSPISNCYVDSKENGKISLTCRDGCIGGIAGFFQSKKITHCYSTVDMEVEASGDARVGGIAGYNRLSDKISYTYATGKMKITNVGSGSVKAGGICGDAFSSSIKNNLALNKEISVEGGSSNEVHRIVGATDFILTNNYASTRTQVNGSPLSNQFDPSGKNGADTWLDTFKGDLLKAPATDNGWKDGNGWKDDKGWDWPDAPSTLLPKLTVVETDNNGQVTGYTAWPGLPAQPNIDAANYLAQRPKLHIKQPQHGTLTVTYGNGASVPTDPLVDGTLVGPGSRLKLVYTSTTDNYSLSSYRWGTSDSNIPNPISGDTYQMPDHEVWLTAAETYTAPEPPYVPPVYYTVTLPQVEGATTDPAAGAYEVEAWDTFRFYLTLDTAYSQSQPVITTSRNETIKPRTSDGAYLVKYVRSDVEIYLDGIVKNNAVANESITSAAAGPRIWSEGSMLCIDLPESHVTTGASPLPVRVLTVDGRLWRTFAASPGLNRWQLPQGLYIVQAGDAVRKVIVR